MKYLTKENIIIIFLGVLIFNSFIPLNSDRIPDLEYEMKLHDLEQDKMIQIKKNHQLEFKIKKFQNDKSKIDSITNGYNPTQIDSFFTDFFQ